MGRPIVLNCYCSFLGACPLLCGGHGDYINGECECHPGWKGKECSLRHDECEVSDCSGRGHCQEGKCQCLSGFTGEFCEQGETLYSIKCLLLLPKLEIANYALLTQNLLLFTFFQLTALTPPALTTGSVLTAAASARKGGRATTAP